MSRRAAVMLAGGLFAASLLGRMVWESRSALAQGARAEAAGRFQDAVAAYDRAAHAYFPGNPYVPRALQALWALGERLEAGNAPLALWAYDAIRGSIFGTRSLYLPHRDWLPRVDDRIARLRAGLHAANSPDIPQDRALAFHRQRLAEDRSPGVGWALLLEASFWAWVAAVFGLIWKGFDAAGRMHFRPSIPWMAAIVVSFALWIVSLGRA